MDAADILFPVVPIVPVPANSSKLAGTLNINVTAEPTEKSAFAFSVITIFPKVL